MHTQGVLVRLAHAPHSPSRSMRPPSPSGTKFCHKILETLEVIMWWKLEVSIPPGLETVPVVTSGWTDRITIANTCCS